MKRFKWVAAIVGLAAVTVLICRRAPDDELPPDGAHTNEIQPLSVITYNVQLLPGVGAKFNKRADPEYRAGKIGQELQKHDIVGLNEVFHRSYRDILLDNIKRSWGNDFYVCTAPEDHRSIFGIDSGLVLASRYPIAATAHATFGNDSSIVEYGVLADGFAVKGVLFARIARTEGQGECIDVFLTHLESRDAEIRREQYRILGEFIKTHAKSENPVLILGDMNTDGAPSEVADETSEYSALLKELRNARKGAKIVDLWHVYGQGGGATSEPGGAETGSRIDYIFLSNPARKKCLEPVSVQVCPFEDPRVLTLSDHAAVKTDLGWRSQRAGHRGPD